MMLLSAATGFTQTNNSNQFISEFIFQNPVLISGTAGQDGAVYKFSNVASGIDATVKIVDRSSSSVVLSNIDVSNLGWNKAFQPQLGIQGNVPANKNWWMDFEMRFYNAGTTTKRIIQGFNATAIDIDGDGASIQEYVQMNKIKSVAYCPVTYLVEKTPFTIPGVYETGDDPDDAVGADKLIQGPVQNFTNIDTAATGVMATFTYKNKDMISFRYGAKSGSIISNAGERLNSLWFKSFNLVAPATLPVKLQSFTASFDNKNVNLSWTSATEVDFSHYVVERSTDGKNYSDVALVFAYGNTASPENYQYKDANVTSASGIIYYRLRLVEQSNEISYSSVRVIKLNKEQNAVQLITYPNPATDQVRITLPNTWQGKTVQLELYTASGIRAQSLQISNASQTESIKLSYLARGFYLVKATCNNEVAQQRIIKD